jgi:riboflavin synthase
VRTFTSPEATNLFAVFTGIVRERARVVSFEGGRLVVASGLTPAVGDSIAVDGACLTVVDAANGHLSFDVMAATTDRTKPFRGEVNLEPALEAGAPLGGHFVQGHVDGVGRVRSFEDGRLEIEAPAAVLRYCVEKGSITVDGVALTITSLTDDGFAVALIPRTLDVTTLGSLEHGDPVNLEADVLAKYVEKLIHRDTI